MSQKGAAGLKRIGATAMIKLQILRRMAGNGASFPTVFYVKTSRLNVRGIKLSSLIDRLDLITILRCFLSFKTVVLS